MRDMSYHHDTLPQDAMRQGLLTNSTSVIKETLKITNLYYFEIHLATDLQTHEELDEMITHLCRE